MKHDTIQIIQIRPQFALEEFNLGKLSDFCSAFMVPSLSIDWVGLCLLYSSRLMRA